MFNRGVAKQPGFLDDYAYLLEAYLTLYESTFDEQWFVRAIELAEAILIRFHDPERGGFFSTSAEHTGLIARRKDLEDAPIPAGASSACFGLLRLARLTGEASYENAALSLIALLHPIAPKHPLAFGHLLRAMDFYAAPVQRSGPGRRRRRPRRRRPPRLLPARGPRGRRRHRGAAVGGPGARRRQPSGLRLPAVHVRPAGNPRGRIGELVAIASCSDAAPRAIVRGVSTSSLPETVQSNSAPDLAVAIRAASQWGVLDVAELRACGLSDDAIARRRRRGTLHRIHPGVYSVNAPPLSMHARFLAATKATNGVLSHYSAATLWRLVDYDPNAPVHVTVANASGARRPRRRRPPHPPRAPGHPPGRHPRHHPGTRLDRPLLDAVVHPTPPRCPRGLRAEARDARQNCAGQTRQLDEALAQGYVPTESELEDATHDLILAHFQPPQVQPTLILDGIPTRPDFRWPDLNLTVEADGAQFHDTPIARQDDAAKQARLEAHGDRVVRVTWDQVMTQPDQTVTRIRMAGAPRRAG